MPSKFTVTEAEELRSIVDSALDFFENLVECAEQESDEMVVLLAQVASNFSNLSDELDDKERIKYGKLCVGIIVNRIVKDHRETGNEQPLDLQETLRFLLNTPIEQLLHLKA